jgi:hypothetical protein
MKMKAYNSDPLPIKFREDQILMYAGNTDQVMFSGLLELASINAGDVIMSKIIGMRLKQMPNEALNSTKKFKTTIAPLLDSVKAEGANLDVLGKVKSKLLSVDSLNLSNDALSKAFGVLELLQGLSNGSFTGPQNVMQNLQKSFNQYEKEWDYINLATALEFVRDDKNQVIYEGQTKLRVFPSSGFILPVNSDNAVKSGVIKESDKPSCHKELRFQFEEQGLSREQVMMLDIMANNEWKRGIFYSSPGGSDVAMALNKAGYIKQNGTVYVLSPIQDRRNRFDDDVMYDNLMKRYDFGDMKNPSVLTDYYARRHTSQFRSQFLILAQYYLSLIEDEEKFFKNPEEYTPQLKGMGEIAWLNDLVKDKDNYKARLQGHKDKAIKLLKRSLEVMPIETVIDGGEPNANTREIYKNGKIERPSYQDGCLQEYIDLFYQAGDVQSAEKYGIVFAKKAETVINYFLSSDVRFIGSAENAEDFYANLDAFMKLYQASKEKNPTGNLAKYTAGKVDSWYGGKFNQVANEIAARENLSSEFSLYIELIGIQYGKLKGSAPILPQTGEQKLDSAMIRQMINNKKVKTDTIKKK